MWSMAKRYRFTSGCVAQLGERRPYKANVGSSNLSTPTIYMSDFVI